MAGSPTSLKVSASACEDLDMETEEEDDLRAKGLNVSKYTNIMSSHFVSVYTCNLVDYNC